MIKMICVDWGQPGDGQVAADLAEALEQQQDARWVYSMCLGVHACV